MSLVSETPTKPVAVPNTTVIGALVLTLIFVVLFWLIRLNPLARLAEIENRLAHFRSPSRGLWAEIGYVPGILIYPNSEAGLQKMWEDEMQKQLALGNLVTLRFPTTNLPAGYSKILSDSARTNFKDGCWNF